MGNITYFACCAGSRRACLSGQLVFFVRSVNPRAQMTFPMSSTRSIDDPRWARELLEDKLPSHMGEQPGEVEEFFDHYASSVENWRLRNAEYHRAIFLLIAYED